MTDADLILGLSRPDFFLGGRMELDREGRFESDRTEDRIPSASTPSKPPGASTRSSTRTWPTRRGSTPSSVARTRGSTRCSLSAGPARCTPTGSPSPSASRVCLRRSARAPPRPSVSCAPRLAFDFKRSLYGRLDDLDWSEVNGALEDMEMEGRDLLRASGVKDEEIQVRRLGEMRYVGQGHEVAVELPEGTLGPDDAAEIEERYRQEYRRLYGREGPDVPLETLTWRLEVASPRPQIRHEPRKRQSSCALRSAQGQEEIYLPEQRGLPERTGLRSLPPGSRRRFRGTGGGGEKESTVVLGPDAEVEIDAARNLIVRW